MEPDETTPVEQTNADLEAYAAEGADPRTAIELLKLQYMREIRDELRFLCFAVTDDEPISIPDDCLRESM